MKALAILIWAAALALAVYVGVFVLLVGGIQQIIDGVQTEPEADGGMIAWGIVKILFASFGASVVMWIGVVLGALCWDAGDRRNRHPWRL